MFNKKRLVAILTGTLLVGSLVGCSAGGASNSGSGSSDSSKITISGSTSVGPLMEKESERFEQLNPQVNVQINQLGSSAGIKDAINGTVEIGMSSRDLKNEEKSHGLVEAEIAIDGMAIITSKDNKIDSLKLSQIRDIYTGKIRNWKDVGGKDSEIVVVSTEEGSGTRDVFQKIVGYTSEELINNAIIGDGSGNIKTTVAGNNHAIGFISFEYLDNSVNKVKIDGIEPNAENVKYNKYKLARTFLLVYKEEYLKENGNKLIDFVLSEEGQNIVEENGLIRIK